MKFTPAKKPVRTIATTKVTALTKSSRCSLEKHAVISIQYICQFVSQSFSYRAFARSISEMLLLCRPTASASCCWVGFLASRQARTITATSPPCCKAPKSVQGYPCRA